MDEGAKQFSVRNCDSLSYIKSFGISVQKPASVKLVPGVRPESEHDLFKMLCFKCSAITSAGNCPLSETKLIGLAYRIYLLEKKRKERKSSVAEGIFFFFFA